MRKRICSNLRYSRMRHLLSMLIGIVVLLSTTGVPRVQHLCGGIVQSAGIWIGAIGCNHESESTATCSTHTSTLKERPSSPSTCCNKAEVLQANEKEDCCTNLVEWEPSQNDLAFSDKNVLEGFSPFVSTVAHLSVQLIPTGPETLPYVRPPPLVPIPQTRRRALLQVYSC